LNIGVQSNEQRHGQKTAEFRGGDGEHLEEFRAPVEALEDTAYRWQDFAERLEFTERLLPRERAPEFSPGV